MSSPRTGKSTMRGHEGMPEDHPKGPQLRDVGLPAELLARIDERFRPVWLDKPPEYQRALAQYFLPRKSKKPVLGPTRPRVLKWYCPFAHQKVFPSGHRYCINVYTGCAHACEYCYAASYEPRRRRSSGSSPGRWRWTCWTWTPVTCRPPRYISRTVPIPFSRWKTKRPTRAWLSKACSGDAIASPPLPF